MYANPVCDYCPHKDEPYRIRLTIVGDKLTYPSDSGSPDTTLLEAKIIFDGVISNPGSLFISADNKNYFFCSPMECFKYIKINFHWITE